MQVDDDASIIRDIDYKKLPQYINKQLLALFDLEIIKCTYGIVQEKIKKNLILMHFKNIKKGIHSMDKLFIS